jgi:hypothetical protein
MQLQALDLQSKLRILKLVMHMVVLVRVMHRERGRQTDSYIFMFYLLLFFFQKEHIQSRKEKYQINRD